MRIERLRLSNLRNIESLDVGLVPGINFFVGANGAGKTSILEGAYVLSHGGSFRTPQNSVLVGRGADAVGIHAEVNRGQGPLKLDMRSDGSGWKVKVNGDRVPTLAAALAEFALVCFEPGSHSLISGGTLERRRFFDWIVFHVEHGYIGAARDYRRVLQQRNALLKANGSDTELGLWDMELVTAAERLDARRQTIFPMYAIELANILSIFLPELGAATITFRRGWPEDKPFAQVLVEARTSDRVRGHTTRGPHRADWAIRFEHAPSREQLSRGQEKLCALACVLAQARIYATARGEPPVVALDDFSSELDRAHQKTAMGLLQATGSQILITGIEKPIDWQVDEGENRLFHVEHGQILGLL
jgi:DNA replication and repair protein RecF